MTLFEQANKVINGARRDAYGPVEESFNRIALIWSGVLGVKVTAKQVAQCMIGLKLHREANSHQDDNIVDMYGYILLLEKLLRLDEAG